MSPVPAYVAGHGLLRGKSVLVTAAAGTGIGFSTATRCAEEGAAAVVLSDRHERRLAESVEALSAAVPAVKVFGIPCDVTVQADVDRLFADASEGTGGVDVVVNGVKFPARNIDDNEVRVIDVKSAMHGGKDNTITLVPLGKPGDSADVTIGPR